ncbi:hypothetical protein IQ07DRAFT_432191 [Pyrenochaeta sp. DS3sAY3a]|nr:hypothetical protein IQ07DRAFT_432191 [Pyrenochaeta sp. DS3sAY3a]
MSAAGVLLFNGCTFAAAARNENAPNCSELTSPPCKPRQHTSCRAARAAKVLTSFPARLADCGSRAEVSRRRCFFEGPCRVASRSKVNDGR